MSELSKYSLLFLLSFLMVSNAYGQCPQPVMDAGLFCDVNAPENPAPVICDLDCLDGFTAIMPDTLLDNQPETLCDGGGLPNNLSWFAFVAGSTTVDITITPSNCIEIITPNGPSGIGIQAGIYTDCVFDTDNIVDCFYDCNGNNEDPVNLSSTEFIPGQVYYLFVDGCGGAICEYEVTVNSGEQAFEMQEITTISNEFNFDLENDTICQGAEVAFRLDDFDLDVNFNWTIEPATEAYPTGLHPVQDTNVVSFIFSDEGLFDIIVFAYNECDASEPDTFSVYIDAIEDEMFSDVVICQECLIEGITLVSPDAGCIISDGAPLILTEDPNSDGVPGWLGLTEINSAGLDSNIVTNTYGCSYTQYVNVVDIPLSPREEVDLYRCLTDFPLMIDGLTFSSPGESKNITIENGAESGCDSLVKLTVYAIDLFGNASLSDCENGDINLAFNIIDVIPADYDSILYIWKDQDGMIVTDTDSDDSVLAVNSTGTYTVMVTVYKDEISCSQTYGPYMVDPENLIPADPEIAFAPNVACITETQALIYVDNQGLGEDYIWTLIPNLPFVFGEASDTIFVDITDGLDFQFCVRAESGCGTSGLTCDDVVVSEAPNSSFIIDTEACLDSIVYIEYTGGDGLMGSSEFVWDFDGGIITNGAAPGGGGPFELQFASSGSYTVSLLLTEGGCDSELFSQNVLIQDPFVAPEIHCESLSSAVVFTFDDTNITNVDIDVISGQAYSLVGTDSILIEGLSSLEEVSIAIAFNTQDVCSGAIVETECTSQPCPSVGLEINLGNQNQCIDEEDRNLELNINVIGDTSGEGFWSSPFVYEGNLFNVLMAGAGEHHVTYSYSLGECTYTVDTTIYLFNSPELDYVIEQSFCEEDGMDLLTIETEDQITVTLDNEQLFSLEQIPLMSTTFTLVATNMMGCQSTIEVAYEKEELGELSMQGESIVLAGNSNSYAVSTLSEIPNVIYSWTINDDIICEDCNAVDVTAEEDFELCLIAHYGGMCSDSLCMDVVVDIETEVYIPNIFSPNQDGINDQFVIKSNPTDLIMASLEIFNRWGQLVKKEELNLSDEAMSWDGTFEGTDCNPGVYVYILKYMNQGGEIKQKVGDLTLMR